MNTDNWIEQNQGKQAYIEGFEWGIYRILRPYIGADGKKLIIIKKTKNGGIYCQLECGKFFTINQRALTVISGEI